METINKIKKMCTCCMDEHEVRVVKVLEHNIFKGQSVEYYAMYEYCDKADELYASDVMISQNDIAMKDAYRGKMGLLLSCEICSIRKKYGISQMDLAKILDWGEKTITRYEGHQVQDSAHDTILRKLDTDPEWYLSLLKRKENKFPEFVYKKYYDIAASLVEKCPDIYLRKSIEAKYVKMNGDRECCGNTALNLDKVIDVISYYANSSNVTRLFKVKLMKLMWYADALSFKRYGHSITGLAYRAFPMGAVPVAYESLIELNGVHYEEIEFQDGTGYKFVPFTGTAYAALSREDINVLNRVISVFGKDSREEMIDRMHRESAYHKTNQGEIIRFSLAEELSFI